MALRPHGQAEVNPDHPQAFAKCDRCGDQCNLVNLRPQMEYAGPALVNTGWLVCETCLDEPNPGLRTVLIPPDPIPVNNPRFEPWDIEESSNIFSLNQTIPAGTLSCNLGTTSPNQRTFTISLWAKPYDVTQFITLLHNDLIPNDTFLRVVQYDDFAIELQNYVGGYHDQSVWNDSSSGLSGFVTLNHWMHIVLAVDTTQANVADRVKIYNNGNLHPTYVATGLAQNDVFSNFMASNTTIYIPSTSNLLTYLGRVAFIQVIDGRQCLPTELGGNKLGVGWSHKVYTGDFGNTGYYFSGDNGMNTKPGIGNAYTFTNSGVTLDYVDVPPHLTI